jgi:hypothetical protein
VFEIETNYERTRNISSFQQKMAANMDFLNRIMLKILEIRTENPFVAAVLQL